MSTPNEFPGPEQPGSQPSPPGYGSQPDPNAPPNHDAGNQGGAAQPPPGYQQPGGQAPGNQPPPGYQQPPAAYPPPGYQQPGNQPPGGQQYQQPGYQQPGGPQPGSSNFELPKDMPRSVQDVLPVGGFSGMFKMDGLPQLLKISYIIWLVTAAIWLFFTFFAFVGSLFLLSSSYFRGSGVRGIVVSIISLVLIAAVVVCAMKLKEGRQWARLALSAIALISIVLLITGNGGSGLLSVVAAVLMWLPESTAWLNSRNRGVSQ